MLNLNAPRTRPEVGLAQRGAERVLVLDLSLDAAAIDEQGGVVALGGIERRRAPVSFSKSATTLVLRVIYRAPSGRS